MPPFVASCDRNVLEMIELTSNHVGVVSFWTSALHKLNIDRTRSLPKITDDSTWGSVWWTFRGRSDGIDNGSCGLAHEPFGRLMFYAAVAPRPANDVFAWE
jgi:hypothetical protein